MTRSRDNATNVAGDISGVTAGTGLSGGGTDGTVTLNLSTPVASTNGGTGLSSFTTGDMIYSSSGNTLAKLGIGTTSQVLTVASGVPSWATPAGGGGITLINSGGTSLSGATTTISSIPTSYKNLYLIMLDVVNSLDDRECHLTFNSDNNNNYNTTGYTTVNATSSFFNTNSTNKIRWGQGTASTTADNKSMAIINIYDYASTGQRIITSDQRSRAGTDNVSLKGTGTYFGSSAITSITFSMGAGVYNSGTAFLYGVS